MSNWVEMGADMTPTWDYKSQKTIEGVLAEKKENVGPNGSNLYVLEDQEGNKTGVWGSAIIDSRLQNAEIGLLIKIEYLGLEKSPKTGREYHNFKLSKDDSPIDTDQLSREISEVVK